MNNKVIQGLWIGDRLSIMEQLSITSFIKNGHEYHLYVYEDVKGIPKGTIIKNADEVVSRELVFKDEVLKSHINFSDLFRYKLLLEKGGYWADTDIICLKPFNFKSDYVFAAERTEKGSDEKVKYGSNWVNGCVMKTPISSEIMKFCYDTCLKKMPGQYGWELGPPILTDAVTRFKLTGYVYSQRTFTPIDWWDWNDAISGKLSTRLKIRLKLTSDVYAVHLWDSMWIRENADKASIYHSKCLYERLKARYLRYLRPDYEEKRA